MKSEITCQNVQSKTSRFVDYILIPISDFEYAVDVIYAASFCGRIRPVKENQLKRTINEVEEILKFKLKGKFPNEHICLKKHLRYKFPFEKLVF